jgi:hypothetical protein
LQTQVASGSWANALPIPSSSQTHILFQCSSGQVQVGDILLAVNGQSLENIPVDTVRRMIVGPQVRTLFAAGSS